MAKGDRKTRKGKIWRGSYGNTRPHKDKKPEGVVAKKKA
jgi:30S ribosomal protein S31